MSKVFFITGCSLGLSIAKHVLSQGNRVGATARNVDDLDYLTQQYPTHFLALPLELTNTHQVAAALSSTIKAFGPIDVVVNNAGAGLSGDFETCPVDMGRQFFDINYWGTLDVVRQALPILRQSGRSSKILVISSVIGMTAAFPGMSYYSASKLALECTAEIIQSELDPAWKIRLGLVLLGGFDTGVLGRNLVLAPSGVYDDPKMPSHKFARGLSKYQPPGDPEKAAKAIVLYALMEDAPMRLILGADAFASAEKKMEELVEEYDKKHFAYPEAESAHVHVTSIVGESYDRIFLIEPNLPDHPQAKFPGCVVFSEIYQVTGPVERFAGNIASEGYMVALPSSFHEFEPPEAIPYDTEGTDRGNRYKIEKTVEAYDEDSTLSVDLLCALPNCNGRIAATGMCLGGHLALRDTHVDRDGRTLIRNTMDDAGINVTFVEVQAQHAFIRDESSKGRWDAALSRRLFGMMMESFTRNVARDLGPRSNASTKLEHIC
ncbi:MAG: hypothetical protein TREMPRED_000517 [Tremellales sp. Tagirdzhanova-0007]|nr:MAG: hypothetical protein TREMPRED_000517 [Tremellales sp. Tagirdzhanova-0007]